MKITKQQLRRIIKEQAFQSRSHLDDPLSDEEYASLDVDERFSTPEDHEDAIWNAKEAVHDSVTQAIQTGDRAGEFNEDHMIQALRQLADELEGK